MRIKLILLALLLSSCSGVPFLTPYKMDIRQGNFVTLEMRDKLKLGMSKQQVRYVLGTPLVSDAFHGNRWDYIYRLEHDRKIVDQQHITIYFEGDKLVRIDDDGKDDVSLPTTLPSSDTSANTLAPATLMPPVNAMSAAIESSSAVEDAQPLSDPQGDPSAEVWQAVHNWAAAWSAKDASRYLAYYAPAFKTGNMSREEWEKQRTSRIEKIKELEVKLSDLIVSVQADGHATATFTQSYRSDRYRDVTQKIMQFEKSADTWLIVSEQVAK